MRSYTLISGRSSSNLFIEIRIRCPYIFKQILLISNISVDDSSTIQIPFQTFNYMMIILYRETVFNHLRKIMYRHIQINIHII